MKDVWNDHILVDENELLSQKVIQEYFHCGKTKMQQLFNSGVLPVTKIGRTYLTTKSALNEFTTNYYRLNNTYI